MTGKDAAYREKYRIDRPGEAAFMEMLDLLCMVEDMCASGEDYSAVLVDLNGRLTRPATINDIRGYYGFQDEEDFIISRCVPDFHEFGGLPDEEILWLIGEIIDNMDDDYIPVFYCAVVDFNTRGDAGRCNELIYCENIREPGEILRRLRSM